MLCIYLTVGNPSFKIETFVDEMTIEKSRKERHIGDYFFYSDGCILLSFKVGSPLPIRDLRSDQSQCKERGP